MSAKSKVPLASVIVAVLNRKEEIGKCLSALLRQDYPNYEILIVDGGSKDGTWEFLQAQAKKSKKLRALQDLRPGRNPARNMGIEKAKGDFVIFTDSDCIPEKSWVTELLKPFKDPEVGGVIGTTLADRKGLFWYHMENKYLQFIGHNNAYRKEIILNLKGFDPRFKIAKEDTDLSFRVISAGWKVVYQPSAQLTHISRRVSVFYRIRNQRTFVYDGLLRRKHPKLYARYMGYSDIRNTGIATAILIGCVAAAPVTLVPLGTVVAAYAAAALSKLVSSDASLKESLTFLLFAWLIPPARFSNFMRGFWKFRDVKK